MDIVLAIALGLVSVVGFVLLVAERRERLRLMREVIALATTKRWEDYSTLRYNLSQIAKVEEQQANDRTETKVGAELPY